MGGPNIWRLKDLLESAVTDSAHINGKWVPARPLGFMSLGSRIRAAYLVFAGRADALIWPEGQ